MRIMRNGVEIELTAEEEAAIVAQRAKDAASKPSADEVRAFKRAAYAGESDPLGLEALAELLETGAVPVTAKGQAFLDRRAAVRARFPEGGAAPGPRDKR